MQIDYALILSAGLGTRMGEIGKKLPKVLWPVYFKTLLELQIRYCEDLGLKKIYINTHYLHDEIFNYLKEIGLDKKIVVLHEEQLLDSGGAIHNLAARPEIGYKGNLLLVNGDQFLFFDKKFWESALAKLATSRAVLFGITVEKEAVYNETVISGDKLIEIKKNTEKNRDYVTYSGLGILNLGGLRPVPGISRFFETVVNFKEEKVSFVVPDKFEYWDFGTSAIYADSIFKLATVSGRNTVMGNFLKRHNAFMGNEKLFLDKSLQAIDLEYKGRFEKHSITGKELVQKF
jgi:mannose-1-phosphate guanylyltransferase